MRGLCKAGETDPISGAVMTCRIVDSSVGWGLKKGMIFDKLSGNDWRVEIFLSGLRFKLPSPVVATQFLKSLPLRHSLLQPPEHR